MSMSVRKECECEEEREEEGRRKEEGGGGAEVASKNKNPTLRMWGKRRRQLANFLSAFGRLARRPKHIGAIRKPMEI